MPLFFFLLLLESEELGSSDSCAYILLAAFLLSFLIAKLDFSGCLAPIFSKGGVPDLEELGNELSISCLIGYKTLGYCTYLLVLSLPSSSSSESDSEEEDKIDSYIFNFFFLRF